MVLTNRWYNFLKVVALVLLPGFSAAYFSLSQIWDLPNAEKVVGTATVIDTLLGLILKASTTQYAKTTEGATDGALFVNKVDGQLDTALGVKGSVEALAAKDTVTLQVIVDRKDLFGQ